MNYKVSAPDLAHLRAIGEKLFANSGKKRYNEFEVKKDVKH